MTVGASRKQKALKGLASLPGRLLKTVCPLCADDTRLCVVCAQCAQRLPWLTHRCDTCGEPLPAGRGVCGPCASKPPPFDHACVAFVYAKPVDSLILALKYGERLSNARILGELLALFAERCAEPKPDVVVPVPSHAAHLRLRGFNPANEIAKIVCRRLGCARNAKCLSRVGERPAQTQMRASERMKLPQNTFRVRAGTALPKRVVVVDDVMTTGATLKAVAAQLKRAGAQRVDVWVVARTSSLAP